MKPTKSLLLLTAMLAAFFVPTRSEGALGSVSTTFSPVGPVHINDIFTVSCAISGYTDVTEIDAYQFKVTYPSALFSFVGGSFDHGTTAAGANQQWLAKSNQETDGTYTPSATDDGSVAGLVLIDLADLGFTPVEQGTNSNSGFMVSFQMKALALGTGAFIPSAPPGGVVFLDKDFNIVPGAPGFVGGSMTVVPEPGSLLLAAPPLAGLFLLRRRSV